MECNKEEAIRAKELAEKKMQTKDFSGARTIAMKAQRLFPDLENISQMLSVCDVHCSAEHRAGGNEMDWYGILQVQVTSDEATIRKQFRKLALLLHPDKNKFPGAEAAFKLIGEAQTILLDPRKRCEHNMKRKGGARTSAGGHPPAPSNRYPYDGMQDKFNSRMGNQSPFVNPNQYAGTVPHQQQGLDAFWTACPFCNIRYQYYKNILNRALRCQSCMKPFIAYDMNAQGGRPGCNFFNPWNASAQGPQGNVGGTTGPIPVPKKTQSVGAEGGPMSHAAEDGNADKKDSVGKKKESKKVQEDEVEVQPRKPQKKVNKKRSRKATVESSPSCETSSTDNEEETTNMNDIFPPQDSDIAARCPRRSARQKHQVAYNEEGSEDDFVEPSHSKKSKTSIRSNGASSSGDSGANKYNPPVSTDPGNKKEDKEDLNMASEEVSPEGKECVHDERNPKEQDVETRKSMKCTKEAKEDSHFDLSPDTEMGEGVDYPDSEFFDFDEGRTESRFQTNQVWALYDTRDGMPRFYARIKRVFSTTFKVQFTWLEPNPTNEDEFAWVKEELPIACGTYKHGDSDTSEMLGMFAYVVSWEKGVRGSYKIFPRKGEVWALYKDWDISWSCDPEKHQTFKYDIVEVISDFNEETGVEVVYLIKVKGFVSVFQRPTFKGPESFKIPSKELLKFSHKIPSYRMTGEEDKDFPEGCFELDPASVPPGLKEFELYHGFEKKKKDLAFEDEQVSSNSSFEEKILSTEHTNSDVHGVRKSNEKNKKEAANDGVKRSSPRRVNGVCEKKPTLADDSSTGTKTGGNSNHGGVSGIKANGTKHQVDNMIEKNSEASSSSSDGGVNENNKVKKNSEGSSTPGDGGIYQLPDNEFCNFERDRSIDKFKVGQVWALYSVEDGFPKYYARIEKVDKNPFHVKVLWFESCPVVEEEIRWSKERLPIGCGTFKLTRLYEDFTGAETFSHLVHPKPTTRRGRLYYFHPEIDEIWAIYKNWKPGMSVADIVGGDLEIVQVLETGEIFRVQILVKVQGYTAVFRRLDSILEIPRSNLLRFSHEVPVFPLTNQKGGKLRGCLELDPAALPLPLLFPDSK
ncbi:hypothetical protein H6P81_002057 [Aristolochia fimbriata]|uniref:J domain-containing protein n=1 Tax=Aristolochia fimbriata TaxID=158543 RepID=A0AAV7FA99_ARIFI|nr:hypothetical protein H6P81_002057 [Aristolochia fimbriata]